MELKGKGYTIFFWKKYIIDNFGTESLDKILSLTDKEVQEIYRGTLLSGDFYTIKTNYQFLEAVEKVLGRAEMIKMTEKEADKEMAGLFGLAARFISVETALKRFQILWDRAFQGGKIELLESDSIHYKVRVSEFIFNDSYRVHQERYMARLAEIATRKKFKSASKLIDKTSAEFIFEELDEPAVFE